MKFYRIAKSNLKWKECPQVSYKWNLPILIDTENNVIIGNSLKDSLSDSIIVVVMDNHKRDVLFQALYDIETKIAEENSENRLNQIYTSINNFFREVRKPVVEQVTLFDDVREDRIITPEIYSEPPAYDFDKHGKSKVLYNEGYVLTEEFLEKLEKGEPDIEIDLEIMKELL